MLTSAERRDVLLASHGWVCCCDACEAGTHDDELVRLAEGAGEADVAALSEGVAGLVVQGGEA